MSVKDFNRLIASECSDFILSTAINGDNNWKQSLGRIMALAFALVFKYPSKFTEGEMERYAREVFREMVDMGLLTESDVEEIITETEEDFTFNDGMDAVDGV